MSTIEQPNHVVLSFTEQADDKIKVSIECGDDELCSEIISWEEVTLLIPTEYQLKEIEAKIAA